VKILLAVLVVAVLAVPALVLAHPRHHKHHPHPKPTPVCQKVPITQLPPWCYGPG
jgi:hypothetical protein